MFRHRKIRKGWEKFKWEAEIWLHRKKDQISDIWYSLKYGPRNIIKWFPVIWKDRDWDHMFFFVMLRQKLVHMEHCFRKHGNHVGSEREADKMRRCIVLLDRILEDRGFEYWSMISAFHDKKWGKADFDFEPVDDGSGNSVMISHRPNVVDEETAEQERREYMALVHREDKMRKQDIEYLFKIISKNILTWWD